MEIAEKKRLWRKEMRVVRNGINHSETERVRAQITARVLHLTEYCAAKSVMFYMAIAGEIDTTQLISEALSRGTTVALPSVDPVSGAIIPLRLNSLSAIKRGAYGIPEPAEIEKIDHTEIELVVVPGLSFDISGNRLGYGKGFYDRFLCGSGALKIGLAYNKQIAPAIPTNQHDIKMDKIVTETDVIEP